MRYAILSAPVADRAPTADFLTDYDREHLTIYLKLLDAAAERAEWTDIARTVLQIDAAQEPARARAAWESHLARAKWMTLRGYRHLLTAAQ